MKKFSILFAVLFLFTLVNVNGQWAEQKGKGYYKLGGWFLLADSHYTDTGLRDPNETRGIFITSLFGRHGISDKFTLIGYIPFVRSIRYEQFGITANRVIQPGEAFNGLGDITLGGEYQLAKKGNWVYSGIISFGLPTGKNIAGSDGSFPTGDGEFNQTLSFNVGTSYKISEHNFYAKSIVGFNQRSKGFSDEWTLALETGSQFFKNKVFIALRMSTLQSLYNGTLSAANSNGSIFSNNIEFVSYGGEIAVTIYKNWAINAGIDSAFLGRIIYSAPSFNFGIATKF